MTMFKLSSLLFVLVLVSCQTKGKDRFTDTLTEGVIPITVDENLRPIIQEELDVFESLNPKAGIVPTYTNEVDAINLLLKDSVRLAIATRPLSVNEEASLISKKFAPRSYKLATDGIALIINNRNSDSLITVSQIKKILTGKIINWSDIYPRSKLGPIQVVFDNQNSSTVRYAIDSICKGEPLSDKMSAQKTNPEVIDFVSKTPNAIGVIGVNWLGNRKDTTNLSFKSEVRVMAVTSENEATVVNTYKPFQAYLFYGYYPLTRSIFVILNDPRSSLPTALTNFLTADKGQRIILKSGLVPATQPVRIVHIKD